VEQHGGQEKGGRRSRRHAPSSVHRGLCLVRHRRGSVRARHRWRSGWRLRQAGNFATPVLFLILFLVGVLSPPAALLWTRRQARRDHDRLQIREPVLAERPADTAAQHQRDQVDHQEPQGAKEQEKQQGQEALPEQPGAPATIEPQTAPPVARPSATPAPRIIEPVYVAQARRNGSGILVATAAVLVAFAVGLILGGKERLEDTRAYAVDRLRDLMQVVGLDMPADQAPSADSEFAGLYKRLGIAPLSTRLEHQADINRGLTRLSQEACDKEAICRGAAEGRERPDCGKRLPRLCVQLRQWRRRQVCCSKHIVSASGL